MNFLRVCDSDISGAKGKVIYLHDGKDIGSGAFEFSEKSVLRILLPRYAGVVSVFATIYSEAFLPIKETCVSHMDSDLQGDTYELSLNSFGLSQGLYYVRFLIKTLAGTLYGI